jgi:hypothetical protein
LENNFVFKNIFVRILGLLALVESGVKHHNACHRLKNFQQYFSYIMATSFSGGRSWRQPPTMGKQLIYKLYHLRNFVFKNIFVRILGLLALVESGVKHHNACHRLKNSF